MIRKNAYPVLEFDDNREALINPSMKNAGQMLPGDKLIISFFGEAISRLLEEGSIEYCAAIPGGKSDHRLQIC